MRLSDRDLFRWTIALDNMRQIISIRSDSLSWSSIEHARAFCSTTKNDPLVLIYLINLVSLALTQEDRKRKFSRSVNWWKIVSKGKEKINTYLWTKSSSLSKNKFCEVSSLTRKNVRVCIKWPLFHIDEQWTSKCTSVNENRPYNRSSTLRRRKWNLLINRWRIIGKDEHGAFGRTFMTTMFNRSAKKTK